MHLARNRQRNRTDVRAVAGRAWQQRGLGMRLFQVFDNRQGLVQHLCAVAQHGHQRVGVQLDEVRR
eukprot:1461-Eustigmatos_ZCMA.PRE.1